MTTETHAELNRICTVICDKICHWPYVLQQEDLDDKCAGCQPLVDLANLIERIEKAAPDGNPGAAKGKNELLTE